MTKNKKIMFVWTDKNDMPTFIPIIEQIILEEKSWDILIVTWDIFNFSEIRLNLNVKNKIFNANKTVNTKKILMTEKPNVVVFGNDTSIIARSFIFAANELSIKTVLIPHGFPFKTQRNKIQVLKDWRNTFQLKYALFHIKVIMFSGYSLSFLKAAYYTFKYGYSMGYSGCSKICVLGNNYKNLLMIRNVPGNKIEVTGNPRFDKISFYASRNQRGLRLKLNMIDNEKLIVILEGAFIEDNTYTVEEVKNWINAIAQAINEIPKCKAILKLHPRENKDIYKSMLKEMHIKNIKIVRDEFPLYDLLNCCDAIIGISSTAILEAMIFNKPVICFSLFKEGDPYEYKRSNSVLLVRNEFMLKEAIESVLYDDNTCNRLFFYMKNFLKENVTNINKGSASKAILKVISSLIEKGS